MSTAAVINLACAVFLLGCAAVLYRLCRTPRPPLNERVQHARARVGLPAGTTVHDVGPDALRLLEETDADLNRYVLGDERLFAHFTKDVDEGDERLRQAIRDEQQKGEQL